MSDDIIIAMGDDIIMAMGDDIIMVMGDDIIMAMGDDDKVFFPFNSVESLQPMQGCKMHHMNSPTECIFGAARNRTSIKDLDHHK